MIDSSLLPYLWLIFFTSAFLKGVSGIGFSTSCLPMLALIIDPKAAIALVIIPSLLSNILMMRQSGGFKQACKAYWLLYLCTLPGLYIGVQALTISDSGSIARLLGLFLLIYILWSWLNTDLKLNSLWQRWLLAPVGFSTGLVNGITGSQLIPLLPYMMSSGLTKSSLVQATNISFTLSSLVMLLFLNRVGMLDMSVVKVVAWVVPFVIMGIYAGTVVRRFISAENFKQVVLVCLAFASILLLTD